jgi:hypothetical protein
MNENIYAIWDIRHETYVKWGSCSDGLERYCVHFGKPMFFTAKDEAERAVREFTHSDDFIVVTYTKKGETTR